MNERVVAQMLVGRVGEFTFIYKKKETSAK